MRDNGVLVIRRAWSEGIRPAPLMTVSEWADEHRLLPGKSSAEPGPWRTDRTPYLREIMDCLSAVSLVEEVVLMKGAQVGGTEVILNALGYVIDHVPGPALLVQPTVELAKRFSRQRVEPLLTSTPRLAMKVAPPRTRDSGNTMLSKEFPGGLVVMTGANSAVGLRSIPAMYAFMDEVDGYPVDVDDEGSPLALVEARQRTFARKKRIKVSTPTIAGRSAIETAYQASDQRHYHVPCPICGEFQPLEFRQLKWTELNLPPEKCVYECRACNGHIHHHQKTKMLARGRWIPAAPGAEDRIRGYHLNGLYAPVGWMSWGDIAAQFVAVHRDPEKHRVFINTVLGEVWTSKGEAPEWNEISARRESYPIGTVPQGALFLTAGCDVQKERIVYEVVGWGRGKASWSIDYGELPGDTSNLETGPWKQVDELLNRTYPHESGVSIQIRMLAIDSGFNTQTVYAWARGYPINRVIAVKGHDHGGVLIGSPTPVEVTVNGRKLKRGARVWPVCSSMAKTELYGWLRLVRGEDGSEPPGFCHFPEYGEQYFRQLTAEHLIARKTRKGYVKLEWELIPGQQNHVLDARVYARAAAMLSGLDRYRESDWAALERLMPARVTEASAQRPSIPTPPTATPKSVTTKAPWIRPRRPGGWLKS